MESPSNPSERAIAISRGAANRLTYLACPYSHPDSQIRRARFEAVNAAAALLMREGELVFSPISHTHPIAEAGDLPKGWEYWREFDRAYLAVSRRFIILELDGWRESIGVTAEIAIAQEFGLRAELLKPGERWPHCFLEGCTMSEPQVIYATVRETIADETPIECRFEDGQKFSAVTVADGFEELAGRIAAFLSYGQRRDQLFRDWLRRVLGGLQMPPDVLDGLVTGIADEAMQIVAMRHFHEDQDQARIDGLSDSMVPGRWFRILSPDGKLWSETSDEEEARAEAARTGWPLERLYVSEFKEWRHEP